MAADEPEPALRVAAEAWRSYRERLGGALEVEFTEVARYAGIEMLRRTIGAARLAVTDEPTAGRRVLEHACRWLKEPPRTL